MRSGWLVCAVLVACGSTSAPPAPPAPPVTEVRPVPAVSRIDQEKKDELAAAHRKLEDEQSTALAATCDDPAGKGTSERCLPSCYPIERPDARAGKKMPRAAEIQHLVCEAGTGPYVIADELRGAKLALRAKKGRLPRPHKKGTWQAAVETALALQLAPEVGKGDVLRVNGKWKPVVHPATKERMRCVVVSHFMKSMKRTLDRCGSQGGFACEAIGNAAAHGLNVVHYRLAEARQLQTAGQTAACQQAALEAVAVARGMPRWRQYMKLNVNQWMEYGAYRTRFDGTLGEDALFSTATSLGTEAQAVYSACGGPDAAPTTPAQEQSFHMCW